MESQVPCPHNPIMGGFVKGTVNGSKNMEKADLSVIEAVKTTAY